MMVRIHPPEPCARCAQGQWLSGYAELRSGGPLQQGEASKTALMVCAYRARASRRESPLISDPWAFGLSGSEGERYADDLDRNYPDGELFIAVRTQFIDRQVRRCLSAPLNFSQVVLLGAGFDARAARLRADHVRFFEVDFPATQADKKARLARLSGYPIDCATYAPCDFEHDDFMAALGAHGFDVQVPALFVWEGVSMYLSETAVRATLRRIATTAHAESMVVFDHLGKTITSGQSDHRQDHAISESLSGMGEPLTFGTNYALPLLYEEGFRYVEQRTADEECLALTGTYDRQRKFRFQHLVVASPSVPHDFVR